MIAWITLGVCCVIWQVMSCSKVIAWVALECLLCNVASDELMKVVI